MVRETGAHAPVTNLLTFTLFDTDFNKVAIGAGFVRTDKAKFPFAGEGVDCEHREQDGVVVARSASDKPA